MKTPSRSLLDTLNREIIGKDEYKLEHLSSIPIDYVIDIGANIGVFSKYANSILNIRKSIIALEPHPINFEYLKENIGDIGTVILYSTALGDGTDVYLTTNPKNEGMYQCRSEADGNAVDSISLHDLVTECGIKDSDVVLLKSDCEGGEVNLMDKSSMECMKYFLQISLEVHYGNRYFKHCPSKEEYKLWLDTFTTHGIYSQNWNSDKNGRVILLKR